MRNNFLKMEDVINFERWQETQDAIAAATGLAIVAVDYKGVAVSEHSNCHLFCQKVRNDKYMLALCQRCDSRGGLEAVRINQPYIYRCHFNIIDIAIPIIVEDKYVGAIMVGQAKFKNDVEGDYLERIVHEETSNEAARMLETYCREYMTIPQFTLEEIGLNITMIEAMCRHIVEEGSEAKRLKRSIILPKYPDIKMQEKAATSVQYDGVNRFHMERTNYTLEPVFQYLRQHKNKRVTLKEMADLCHLSPSYFSRLFSREMKESFTSYVTKEKMEWAKDMLLSTDDTVTQIGQDLGYVEVGYFIKCFKKAEGLTPLEYRQLIQG